MSQDGQDASHPPREVLIDGVRYVPVSDAHISVTAIEDAVVGQWAGDNWRKQYPDALSYLHVVVTEDNEGDTVTKFVASILAAAERAGDERQ